MQTRKKLKNKKTKISFVTKMLLMKKAGLTHRGNNNEKIPDGTTLDDLPKRIRKILDISNKPLKATEMMYFVMYDIENNKVRTQIAKYLERQGCLRVQKSIFFADSERNVFNQIHNDLKAIQELYDNHDSILLVPVSNDQLRAMKIIGQNIDVDLIAGNINTLFF
jgi:CRISPR-associated protein Cas2